MNIFQSSDMNDLTDSVFGRLTVVSFSRITKGKTFWNCLCSCGTEKEVRADSMKDGSILSCGCLHSEAAKKRGAESRTHGHFRNGKMTPTYRTWALVKRRCKNPNAREYKFYGGRGIRVCERWEKFERFLEDMGEKPDSGSSIERLDSNGNYSPENCRWLPRKLQARNRRSSRIIEFRGEKKCVAEWAERTGISQDNVLERLNAGWTVEDALLKPIKKTTLKTI